MWEKYSPIDLPVPNNHYFYKYSIWDIDGDGRTEVLAAFPTESGNFELQVIDGQTGQIKQSTPLEVSNPTSSSNQTREKIYVTVADTRGLGRPQDIVFMTENGTYPEDIRVFDANLNLLADTLYGEGGNDTAIYSDSNAAVNVNLATGVVSGGDAEGDVLITAMCRVLELEKKPEAMPIRLRRGIAYPS